MSDIELNPMFLRIRRSIGNIVIYQRDGKYFTRVKPQKSGLKSAAQSEVTDALTRLANCWSAAGAIMRISWLTWGDSRKINGYRGFVKINFAKEKAGEPIELTKQLGEIEPPVLTATAGGAGEIVCTFSISPADSGRHINFFIVRRLSGKSYGEIRRISGGSEPVSPFTISGLAPGSEYFLYAVLTDSEFKTATEVSASAGVIVTAGV
jgi:hypothetical protein